MCRLCPVHVCGYLLLDCLLGFMQFSKGIICRKLSRKYEFMTVGLVIVVLQGIKWIFSCRFHIFWLNWVMFAVE